MLSHDFYLAYLNSAEWRSRRNRALQLAGYRCEACGGKRHLQVDHKTYERLGCEWDEDIQVLCVDCHEGVTIARSEASSEGVYLKLARQALREEPFGGVANLVEAVKVLCAAHKVTYDSGRITRAIELVIGTRFQRPPAPVRADGSAPDRGGLTDQEAREVLCRLRFLDIPKSMPPMERSPEEQDAHERRIRQQIAAAYLANRPHRRPVRERLEEIFASRGQ